MGINALFALLITIFLLLPGNFKFLIMIFVILKLFFLLVLAMFYKKPTVPFTIWAFLAAGVLFIFTDYLCGFFLFLFMGSGCMGSTRVTYRVLYRNLAILFLVGFLLVYFLMPPKDMTDVSHSLFVIKTLLLLICFIFFAVFFVFMFLSVSSGDDPEKKKKAETKKTNKENQTRRNGAL
jgi:Ca2+/Na+ antiporter